MNPRAPDDWSVLCEAPLELEDAAVERSDEAIIGDKDLRLLLRENRIALAKGVSRRLPPDGGTSALYDVPLICVVEAHPECRFQWARLMIDLSAANDARIRDMSPREVRGDGPVEIKTTVGLGLKFEALSSVLSGELKPEVARSRTVYYPEIVSSGIGFSRAYWIFDSRGKEYLHANRELRLLISAPPEQHLLARFQLRAKVKLAGFAGLIPLLMRSGEIEAVHRLD